MNEEQFQRDLQQAKMISRLQTTLPEGEPSTRAGIDVEDGLFEEELVDFEPSPSHTQTILVYNFQEEIVSALVMGLEAIGGEMDAPTEHSRELSV